MKPSEEKKDTLFDIAKSISEVSQIGNSYGRLAELRDLQVHIQTRINELEKENFVESVMMELDNSNTILIGKEKRDETRT